MDKVLRRKAVALALVGVLGTTTLSGCGNKQIIDMKYTFNKALIINGNTVTIVNIKSWTDYEDGEQMQIQTEDGMYILTSAYDTKLIDDKNSENKAEDLARAIIGDDVIIEYYDDIKTKTLK